MMLIFENCEMYNGTHSSKFYRLDFLSSPSKGDPMNSCLSLCLCVHPSVRQYTLLGICSLVFSQILHSNENIEIEKSDL